jgi:lantibiotic modifying enzyme
MTLVEEKYLNAAFEIGSKYIREAIWDNDRCNWISPSNNGFLHKNFYRSLKSDFYEGTSGIAFFLMHLYKLRPDPILKITLTGALNQISSAIKDFDLNSPIGFYDGLAGMAYTLIKGAEILEDDTYRETATMKLKSFDAVSFNAERLDVINGLAGVIPTLLSISHSKTLAKIARRAGDYLIQVAEKSKSGWSWDTLPQKRRNLTGFAHGTAGIATAFLELFQYSADKKYLDAAEQAFFYEDNCFHIAAQNWIDFRSLSGKENDQAVICATAWCHGAPGIALARIRAYEITGEVAHKKKASIGLNTTADALSSWIQYDSVNLSLCHGIAGNAECINRSNVTLKEDKFLHCVESAGEFVLDKYIEQKRALKSGLINMEETMGFMLGNAGIGYFLLRLSNPKKIPSILLMSPKNR